jgi:hypothetical protein
MKTITHERIRFEGIPTSEEVMERTLAEGRDILLAFSTGKDAVLAWMALRDAGFTVHPYYMFSVPDLQFVERSLQAFEQHFGRRIMRVPHASFYRMLNNFVFQPPERCAVIEKLGLPEFTLDQLRDCIVQDLKLPPGTWSASGVRASDSLMRRTHFRTNGPVNHKRRMIYPVWDVRKGELVDRILAEGVPMPVDYELFGRSFDGVDFRFLNQIKIHFPDDFARILEWFPLAELELKRFEYAQKDLAKR